MFLDLYEHLVEGEKPNPEDIFKSATPEEHEERLPQAVRTIIHDLGLKLDHGLPSYAWDYICLPKKFSQEELDNYFVSRGFTAHHEKPPVSHRLPYLYWWIPEKIMVSYRLSDNVLLISDTIDYSLQESDKPNPDDIFKSVSSDEMIERLPDWAKEIVHKLGLVYKNHMGRRWVFQAEANVTPYDFAKAVSLLGWFQEGDGSSGGLWFKRVGSENDVIFVLETKEVVFWFWK